MRFSSSDFTRRSTLETLLTVHIQEAGLPTPVTEYRFHDIRRWRFDFAWPDQKVAAEVEGGTYRKSRHTSGPGFHNDCEKYNTATIMGWQVMRFDGPMIHSMDAIVTLKMLLL